MLHIEVLLFIGWNDTLVPGLSQSFGKWWRQWLGYRGCHKVLSSGDVSGLVAGVVTKFCRVVTSEAWLPC